MTLFRLALFSSILWFAGVAQAGELTSPYATRLAATVRSADTVVIEYYAQGVKEEVKFEDPVWREKLASVLEASDYKSQSHCLCVSYPKIRLMKGSEEIGSLSVHHEEKLRAYTKTVSGDFFVGSDVGAAVTSLAMKKKGYESSQPTSLSRRG